MLGKEAGWIRGTKKISHFSSFKTTIEEGQGPHKHPAQVVNLISIQTSQEEVAKPNLNLKQECLSHDEISCKSLEYLALFLQRGTKSLGKYK